MLQALDPVLFTTLQSIPNGVSKQVLHYTATHLSIKGIRCWIQRVQAALGTGQAINENVVAWFMS